MGRDDVAAGIPEEAEDIEPEEIDAVEIDAVEIDAANLDAGELEDELAEDEEALEEEELDEEVVEAVHAEEAEREVLAPTEVEATLDEILRWRTEGEREEEPEVEQPAMLLQPDEIPHGPSGDEFVCRSCHLVKRRTQLVDLERMLCNDCA